MLKRWAVEREMLPLTLKLCRWSSCISSGRGQLGIRTLGETLKSFLCEILSEAGKGGVGTEMGWEGPLTRKGADLGLCLL